MSWQRRALLVLGALVGILLVGATFDLLRIRSDLQHGRATLDTIDLDSVREAGGVGAIIDEASGAIERADDRARNSPFLSVLAPLPVVGTQVTGLRELTGATSELGDLASTSGQRIDDAIEAASASGPARVELLDVVLEEVDLLAAAIEEIDSGSARLIGPGASARRQLDDALARAPDRLDRLATEVAALRDLLAGPTRYLLVAANNAEMRGGAAIPLQAGLVTFDNGEIEVGEMLSAVDHLYAPDPTGEANANPPELLLSTYPRWNIGRDLPETSVTPNFPVTAPMYADIAADAQGWDVEGVVQLDVVTLQELLDVLGPVEFDGTKYTSENVARLVLHEPYVEFDTFDERGERQDRQSELARALLEDLESAEAGPVDLAVALRRSAQGRHLLAWSEDPVLERMFASFGAAGTVPPGSTLVSVQNTGANKLDFFIDPSVELEVENRSDRRDVTMSVTVPNPVPESTSPYIDGGLIKPQGTHRVYVSIHLPAVASGLRFEGYTPTEFGFDGPLRVIGARFTIPRGSERTVVLHYQLPADHTALRVLPSGRLRPVPWQLGGSGVAEVRVDDATGFTVPLVPISDDEPELGWPLAALLLAAAGALLLLHASGTEIENPRAARVARIDVITGVFLLSAAVVATVVWLLFVN